MWGQSHCIGVSELGLKPEGRTAAGEKLRRAVSTVEHPGGGEEALSNWERTVGEKVAWLRAQGPAQTWEMGRVAMGS